MACGISLPLVQAHASVLLRTPGLRLRRGGGGRRKECVTGSVRKGGGSAPPAYDFSCQLPLAICLRPSMTPPQESPSMSVAQPDEIRECSGSDVKNMNMNKQVVNAQPSRMLAVNEQTVSSVKRDHASYAKLSLLTQQMGLLQQPVLSESGR